VRGKETSGAGSRPGTQEDGGTDDVISASRNVPAATGKPASSGRIPPGKASPGKDAPAPGANVLAFPEPKGRRRRRRVLAAVATVCVLVAALLAAAIYSPVLALQTVSVSGTSLLAPAQVQAALEPLKGKPLPQITDDEVRRPSNPWSR
jgi:cell division protein FtsQ